MKLSLNRILAAPAAAAAIFLVHCTPNFDAAKDCQEVCQRYDDCIDDDFDVRECASSCRDRADADNDFETKLDACEDCMDANESCASSGRQCTNECAPVYAGSS